MKGRWKLVCAALTGLALLAAACGGGEPAPPPGATPRVETIERGVLTVGSDIPFPPFEFEEEGRLTGFDVQLAEEIGSRLDLRVKWVDSDFRTIFTQLAGGRFDLVASATTITPEREQRIDFTRPYYNAQQALAVNTRETPDIRGVDDLGDGHVVAVQEGTTGEGWARENLAPKGIQIRSFPQALDTYTALEAGNVTAVLFDEPSAVEEAEKRPALEVVEAIDTGEQYGFGVDPQNRALLEAVNRALEQMLEDGTYERIYRRWFPEAPAGSVLEGS